MKIKFRRYQEMRLNYYTIKLIEKEIERLEEVKKNFPAEDEAFMYEPDLSQLKQQLEEVKAYV
jgi:hypothetical protein